MTVRLNGSTSGYVELGSPAVGGNNTLFLPNGNGSNGQILGTDGAGNLSWVNGRMVLETAKASTSGTSIDFTGIPSWVKRVTVMFNGVSTNGSSLVQVQLGAGSITSSGYVSAGANLPSGSPISANSLTSGFCIDAAANAAAIRSGVLIASLMGSNTWVYTSSNARSDTSGVVALASGSITLSGTLDRIRVTTVNGTDTFDAGSINILYEG